MTALSYRLLTTDLIELWLAISISDLLATVLMQRSLVFPLIHYLLPSRLGLKLEDLALCGIELYLAKWPVEPVWD